MNEVLNLSDKTILIVEDEYVNTQYLVELLTPTKALLLYAATAEEAIALCESNPEIDLVLMDIKLPDENGFTVTELIRKKRADLPIIAQTAYAFAEDRSRALKAGCNDYIAKPIRGCDLIALIHKYI